MAIKYCLALYLDWCKNNSEKPLLADYFNKFHDDITYKASEISLYTGLHKQTPLNWFKKGLIINQSASNAFRGYGKDIKDVLFNRTNCIAPIKENPIHQRFFIEQYQE